MPPLAPRVCFGRDDLIEEVVKLAENLEPIALIGAGGIGKTSIALTVLHHERIERRFGENRRFIQCDQFPASCVHFLARLSKVIGAGIESPEDLTSLRPFLSSKEMLIVLDNAECILDPKGANAKEVHSLVDKLCRIKTIGLCIASRVTTVPPYCKRPTIPALSIEAARNIFCGIYGDGGRSSIIDNLLQRLDFHALSITLLATAASHNGWSYGRLVKEWNTQRAQVLQTDHNKSLAATIELSLGSPTFRSLGPDARDLLGVIAFFPQGVDKKNLDWLFPTISNRKNMVDKFRVLSLTHRNSGFTTMLAPIRDYLGPQDPQSSPLLRATRDRYFSRLSVDVNPSKPGFGEARWIVSEDVNVEHLLDVSMSIDQSGDDALDACFRFMRHLYWHKPRQTILKPKIEGLPDDHHYKPKCLSELSRLFQKVGNHAERKRLLIHALELGRRRGDEFQVAETLRLLSDANRLLGLREEGIRQAREVSEICQRIGDTSGQIGGLNALSQLLFSNKQLDAAEEAISRALNLITEKDQEYTVCQLNQVLGRIHQSKGEKRKAIHHFETALGIASTFNWQDILFWTHYFLAELFQGEEEFEDAHAQIEQAKLSADSNTYHLGRITHLQAVIWYRQRRFEETKSEASHALEIFEKLGAAKNARSCRNLLQKVEQAVNNRSTGFQGELLETTLRHTSNNFNFLS